MGAKYIDKLAGNLRICKNYWRFKKSLKDFLVDNVFYTVDNVQFLSL